MEESSSCRIGKRINVVVEEVSWTSSRDNSDLEPFWELSRSDRIAGMSHIRAYLDSACKFVPVARFSTGETYLSVVYLGSFDLASLDVSFSAKLEMGSRGVSVTPPTPHPSNRIIHVEFRQSSLGRHWTDCPSSTSCDKTEGGGGSSEPNMVMTEVLPQFLISHHTGSWANNSADQPSPQAVNIRAWG